MHVGEDPLVAYPIMHKGERRVVDTSAAAALAFPAVVSELVPLPQTYHESPFDLNVLAVPFKFRPEQQGHPRQLGTGFSGALYAGYRTDRHRIAYESTSLGIANRQINHYGYSLGIFSGIGAGPVNPWVTQNRYPDEMDGLAWMNGVAAIVGINSFWSGAGGRPPDGP